MSSEINQPKLDFDPASDITRVYLSELANCPRMTPEETSKAFGMLAAKKEVMLKIIEEGQRVYETEIEWQSRLKAAKHEVVSVRNSIAIANLGLVVKFASLNPNRYLSMLDLISAGNIGLLKAVEKFDPTVGCQFSTYAFYWIREAVQESIQKEAKIIRIPTSLTQRVTQFLRYVNEKEGRDGRKPTVAETSQDLKISTDEARLMFRITTDPISIENSQALVLNRKPNSNSDLPASESETAEEERTQALLELLIIHLNPRELEVICERVGLVDRKPKTLQKIADSRGMTKERIRQIQEAALSKLRDPQISQKIQDLFGE